MGQEGTCLQGTRRSILNAIQEWLKKPDAELILWLHGMAGTGKTSVARTIADGLDKGILFKAKPQLTYSTHLGASFFFKHEDSTRNSISHLIPTVARNLAQRIPQLRQHITDVIRDDMGIGTKLLQEQMRLLILKPLSKLSKELLFPIRLIIVVDALDECKEQSGVEQMLGLLPSLQSSDQVQVRVLIISRPESHIQSHLPMELVYSLALEKVSPCELGDQGRDDITLFMTNELNRITKDRKLESKWLPETKIGKLVEKADGLFLYAAITCRFLDVPTISDELREGRVEKILQGKPVRHSPEEKIAEIYLKVLTFASVDLSQEEKTETYNDLRKILGLIALVFEPVSITTLSIFLQVSKGSLSRKLEPLHSIVNVPEDGSSPLGFCHLSLRDYLLNKERSNPDFWIEEIAGHRSLFERCLQVMQEELHQDMCDLHLPGSLASEVSEAKVEQHISRHLQYSCLYWVDHLSKLGVSPHKLVQLEDDGVIHRFLLDKFLYWLETLSLMGKMPMAILMINHLQTLIDVSATLCCLPSVSF